jgi:hypothetical protein
MNMTKKLWNLHLSFLLGIILCLWGCGAVQPTEPASSLDPIQPPSQKTSTISVPISMDLKPYYSSVEKEVPKQFDGKEQQCEGVSYAYLFKRKAIDFSTTGDALRFAVDGTFRLNIEYCPKCTDLFDKEGNCLSPRIFASCGVNEPMLRASVAYNTKLKLSNNYRLLANTTFETFQLKDPCEVTVFQFDASDKLRTEVTKALKSLEKEIDNQIGKVDVKSSISGAWKSLCTPIPIEQYGSLYLQPQALSVGKLHFANDQMNARVHINLKPVFSTEPIKLQSTKLPEMSKIDAEDKGFHLELDVRAGYDSINKILSQQVAGTELNVKKRKIRIDSLQIFNTLHNRIHLKISFSGHKKGILFITATPQYDAATHWLSFPDAEFDLQTNHALLRTAKWLFEAKITDLIREKARYNLSQTMEEMRASVEKQINTEIDTGVFMKGHLSDMNISGIFPTNDHLILRMLISGNIELNIR